MFWVLVFFLFPPPLALIVTMKFLSVFSPRWWWNHSFLQSAMAHSSLTGFITEEKNGICYTSRDFIKLILCAWFFFLFLVWWSAAAWPCVKTPCTSYRESSASVLTPPTLPLPGFLLPCSSWLFQCWIIDGRAKAKQIQSEQSYGLCWLHGQLELAPDLPLDRASAVDRENAGRFPL